MSHTRSRPAEGVPSFPRIARRRLAGPGGLAGDALEGVESASRLFGWPPGPVPDAAVAGRAGSGSPLPAEAFVATSEGAAARLERIRAGQGVAVTTGQQPGLFLGPLYTLYKALTAVRVAEEIERRTGRPALAVFWVASDDHDWEEVAACRILGVDEALLTLRLAPPPGRAGRSVGPTALPAEVADLLARLRSEAGGAVVGTPPPWLDALRDAYRPGRTFAAAFVAALAAALRGRDAAILDSAHPALRAEAADLYRGIVRAPGRVIEAMTAGREAVRAAGYEPSLTPPPDGLQIFYDDETGRQHVLRSGAEGQGEQAFEIGDTVLAREDLLRRLEETPGAFSPAAALRPVLESRLLPVAATVLGPGEIAYWAQLRPLFETLDAPMPAIVPRDAWTLVEPRVDRLLDKLDLDVETVEAEGEGIDDRWIARARPPAVARGLSNLEARLGEAFATLEGAIDRELPGLRSAAGKAEHRARQAVDELGRTVDARVRERESIALDQAARVRAHLLPDGRPQERTVAAAQFLARHGRPLVDDLLRAARVAGPEGPD